MHVIAWQIIFWAEVLTKFVVFDWWDNHWMATILQQAVQKRVKEAASKMDSKEWDNVSQFLRQVYQTGDDMKAIAGGIYDPEKKKQALVDAEDIKKIARASDVPVSKQDGGGFLAAAKKLDDIYEDFLEQLRDIPDEL